MSMIDTLSRERSRWIIALNMAVQLKTVSSGGKGRIVWHAIDNCMRVYYSYGKPLLVRDKHSRKSHKYRQLL
jgi:hypothetical protein